MTGLLSQVCGLLFGQMTQVAMGRKMTQVGARRKMTQVGASPGRKMTQVGARGKEHRFHWNVKAHKWPRDVK